LPPPLMSVQISAQSQRWYYSMGQSAGVTYQLHWWSLPMYCCHDWYFLDLWSSYSSPSILPTGCSTSQEIWIARFCDTMCIVAKTPDKSCLAYYLSLKLRLFTKQPIRRQVALRATYHM